MSTEYIKGTLVYKTINGKKQPYLQWTENGKSKSRYIKKEEREQVFAALEARQRSSGSLRSPAVPYSSRLPLEMNAVYGIQLKEMAGRTAGFQKRDCFHILEAFLSGPVISRVCIVYGLRRTGKTTMLMQAIECLSAEEQAHAIYIKARPEDNMAMLNRDLDRLLDLGYKYIFLDEITLMEDFIDGAALLSDIYAASGMKIVLSGTDSLGFYLSSRSELYDRTVTLHTTWIPYREHSRLLGTDDIDEYIRFGGTLLAGETAFGDPDALSDNAAFRDDESTRRYIDTAICLNIQHSLAFCHNGSHFRHLQDLYEAGELTNAINRVIEDINHRFLVSVITRDFRSSDYGSAAQLLRKERDPQKRTTILDSIDRDEITEKLMEILDIRSKEKLSIGITAAHVEEIREYLRMLELTAECPVQTLARAGEPMDRTYITQPGMRYSQAQALVYTLINDEEFSLFSRREQKLATQKILEDVRGRMMEDIVLYETALKYPKGDVCRVDLGDGRDIDMLIYDAENDTCSIFEIKHSTSAAPAQYRIITDEEICEKITRKFGSISRRAVIYRGPSFTDAAGMEYIRVEEYLNQQPV